MKTLFTALRRAARRLTTIRVLMPSGTSTPALAAEPCCVVKETCSETNDNCQPATGRLEMPMQPGDKAMVVLDDREGLEAMPLVMSKMIRMIFTSPDKTQHQLRPGPDGRFNYLINTPNPDAWNGKDQVLCRGICVEG